MTDRQVFNLFYGARESKPDMYRAAYENGADINFQFDGRKGTRGGGGRWYYGDTMWYAPDGVDGDKNDTLLHIGVKCGNRSLVAWLLTLERIDITRKNGRGLDAFQIAKDMGREDFLAGLEVAVPLPNPTAAAPASGQGANKEDATSGAPAAGPPAAPEAGGDALAGVSANADDVARLTNTARLLRATITERDTEVERLSVEMERYKLMLREKDADIGELQNNVLCREREAIVMMHKIERLQAQLNDYTDPRQAHADKFEGWGEAGYHNADAALQHARGA